MLFHQRLHRLQLFLSRYHCDGMIINDQINLFYLTGLDLSSGQIFIHQHGAYLLVDRRYIEMAQKLAPLPVLSLEQYPLQELLSRPEIAYIRNLGFDSESLTYKDFTEINESLKHKLITLVPLQNPVKQLRSIKEEDEILALRRAAQLGSEGFDFVCSLLKEGISEIELAMELEIFWKKRGSRGVAFDPIIAFGANSSMPHYRAGSAKLRKGDTVLIDIGVNYQHYHSDMTRVLFFGEPPKQMREIFLIVQHAQNLALEKCHSGISCGELDEAARSYIQQKGYGEYFTHSLGHGIGLEIHEVPLLRNKPPHQDIVMKSGMVVTIEPGIYLPGIGGIRLEDTVLITDKGYESLTKRPINFELMC